MMGLEDDPASCWDGLFSVANSLLNFQGVSPQKILGYTP